ncbi:hypothetical protein AAG570_005096 [Ranatra chinensis]|uniref:Uncharacterized protein n=1 Tax=Ranatra chinensis TaxID=642074 RepID=A0ABD0YL88_9HEMI
MTCVDRATDATDRLISKTTSTEPPLEDPTYYDEVVEEEQKEELQTTTTEAPKKTLLRGSVRPFKSNEDLLAALRKRRLLDGKPSQPSTKTPNTVPSAASQPNSAEQTSVRRGKSNPNTSANETGGRKFSPRGGSKQLSQQQDVTSTEQPVEQAKVSRFRGRKS